MNNGGLARPVCTDCTKTLAKSAHTDHNENNSHSNISEKT
jgi:hypothetical protein